MANLDRSPLNSLTHLSIEIAQIIYPHSHLALLPSLECFRLKASDLSVKLLASIPTRMPNLKRFQMLCQGKIVSASSLDLFIETNKLDQLPILSEELEIWLAPETHVAFSGLYRNRRPPKPTHMDDLVRVFVDRIPSLLPQTKLYPLRPQ
ncbi:hypothetical protein DL96DRAFT_1172 [Flagelloscypha sp. PMI_526]|nr:hypothetical protein DL96DRAFT_1172 [Flagelloscypha sp. PMI_526]